MKKFFNKKVMDYKFRKAGEGHRLDDEGSKPRPSPSSGGPTSSSVRAEPSSSSASAGQAAISRLGGEGRKPASSSQTSRPPTHSHKSLSPSSLDKSSVVPDDVPEPVAAVGNLIIRLVCPICQQSIPYSEIQDHLSFCLQEEYIKEPLTASVQMLHTLCTDSTKRKLCIDTLCKYLDNILQHPGEEKFCKIRTANKTFSEKVSCVSGADLFLEAVGFQQQLLPHGDSEEQFYVLPSSKGEDGDGKDESESGCGVGGVSGHDKLELCKELLSSTEPLKPALDRQITLFRSSHHVTNFDLSDDFYHLSLEEIKKEQKQRTDAVERSQQLRTKAMRERDEIRTTTKYYRYTVLRIRLPDGLFLQAAFRPLERLQVVREVVAGVLIDVSLTFSLSAFGQLMKNESDSQSLALLGLVPSAVLNLSWNGDSPKDHQKYLDPKLLQNIQKL